MSQLTPREIVSELDRFIIGQKDAKRAVAVALRNRWRRAQVEGPLRDEIVPKNILMIGPTGVGKTEIARRLAKLAEAPFIKIEATKFTEVGYVGRDVDSILRDLVETALQIVRERQHREVRVKAEATAENRLLDALVGTSSTPETRRKFRDRLHAGELEETEIELDLAEASGGSGMSFDIPGMPGSQIGMINLSDMLGKAMGGKTKKRKLTVAEARPLLVAEESEKLLDQEALTREAIRLAEESGIVFLDEIDKICARSDIKGGEVSREGVQRDLLPLIEGTVVNTKYGPVKSDHVLFIASGAFHMAKPADLLPELQGRLPIRVELSPLSEDDMLRILTEPESSLIRQTIALFSTEGVTLDFTQDGTREIAALATRFNREVENIGARRLHTLVERLVEDLSFEAPDRNGQTVAIDAAYVREKVGEMAKDIDLAKFIL